MLCDTVATIWSTIQVNLPKSSHKQHAVDNVDIDLSHTSTKMSFRVIISDDISKCLLKMRRFQTKEEIDLDDEDIEFIVQQVSPEIFVMWPVHCGSSGCVTDHSVFMSSNADVEDPMRRISPEDWWTRSIDPYSVVSRPAPSPL